MMRRIREEEEEEDITEVIEDKVSVQNTAPIDDVELARNRIMGKYNAGQSIIQPPESTDRTLGDAIREQLHRFRISSG